MPSALSPLSSFRGLRRELLKPILNDDELVGRARLYGPNHQEALIVQVYGVLWVELEGEKRAAGKSVVTWPTENAGLWGKLSNWESRYTLRRSGRVNKTQQPEIASARATVAPPPRYTIEWEYSPQPAAPLAT